MSPAGFLVLPKDLQGRWGWFGQTAAWCRGRVWFVSTWVKHVQKPQVWSMSSILLYYYYSIQLLAYRSKERKQLLRNNYGPVSHCDSTIMFFQQWKSSENREYDMKQTVHWVDAKTWIDKSLAEDSLGFTFKQWIICNWSSTFHWKQLFYVNKSKIDHGHTGHIWAPRLMLQKEGEIENLKDW